MIEVISALLFVHQLFFIAMNFEVGDLTIEVLGIMLSPFDLVVAFVLFVVTRRLSSWADDGNKSNRVVFRSILFYTIYQLLVVLPISTFNLDIQMKSLFRNLAPRLYFLLIPFFYVSWVSRRGAVSRFYFYVHVTAVVLFGLVIFKLAVGNLTYTNTGELRMLWGGAALIFGMLLIHNLALFGGKTNVILLLLGLIGMVFANHRSAYVVLIVLAILAAIAGTKTKVKGRTLVSSLVVLALSFVLLSQIPYVRDNFVSRFETSLDAEDENAAGRLSNWRLSLIYFSDHPLNGSLLSDKYYRANDYSMSFVTPDIVRWAPHNFLIEFLATQGIVGFIFLLFILGGILRIGFQNRADAESLQMVMMVSFYCLFCLFNTNFLNNWNILMLVVPAAIILDRNKKIEDHATSLAYKRAALRRSNISWPRGPSSWWLDRFTKE